MNQGLELELQIALESSSKVGLQCRKRREESICFIAMRIKFSSEEIHFWMFNLQSSPLNFHQTSTTNFDFQIPTTPGSHTIGTIYPYIKAPII